MVITKQKALYFVIIPLYQSSLEASYLKTTTKENFAKVYQLFKLKRTTHTKYAVKLNSRVLTLTFEWAAETQVLKGKPSRVSAGMPPLKFLISAVLNNYKLPVLKKLCL